mmetsp:Transcript_45074/g.140088  ORF Transcript_45074/g.140088 Transcript_45074/m.140088 type:complete len:214 (-) Transcript_45074:729-1370(-)
MSAASRLASRRSSSAARTSSGAGLPSCPSRARIRTACPSAPPSSTRASAWRARARASVCRRTPPQRGLGPLGQRPPLPPPPRRSPRAVALWQGRWRRPPRASRGRPSPWASTRSPCARSRRPSWSATSRARSAPTSPSTTRRRAPSAAPRGSGRRRRPWSRPSATRGRRSEGRRSPCSTSASTGSRAAAYAWSCAAARATPPSSWECGRHASP